MNSTIKINMYDTKVNIGNNKYINGTLKANIVYGADFFNTNFNFDFQSAKW